MNPMDKAVSQDTVWLTKTLDKIGKQNTQLYSNFQRKTHWLRSDLTITKKTLAQKFLFKILAIFPKYRKQRLHLDQKECYRKLMLLKSNLTYTLSNNSSETQLNQKLNFNTLLDAYNTVYTTKKISEELKFNVSTPSISGTVDFGTELQKLEKNSPSSSIPFLQLERVYIASDGKFVCTHKNEVIHAKSVEELAAQLQIKNQSMKFAICVENKPLKEQENVLVDQPVSSGNLYIYEKNQEKQASAQKFTSQAQFLTLLQKDFNLDTPPFFFIDHATNQTQYVELNPFTNKLDIFPSVEQYEMCVDAQCYWPFAINDESTYEPTASIIMQKIVAIEETNGTKEFYLVDNQKLQKVDSVDAVLKKIAQEKKDQMVAVCVENIKSKTQLDTGNIANGSIYFCHNNTIKNGSYTDESSALEFIEDKICDAKNEMWATFSLHNNSSNEQSYVDFDPKTDKITKFSSIATYEEASIKEFDKNQNIKPVLMKYMAIDDSGMVYSYDPLDKNTKLFCSTLEYQNYLEKDLSKEAKARSSDVEFIHLRQVTMDQLAHVQSHPDQLADIRGRPSWISLSTNTFFDSTKSFLNHVTQNIPTKDDGTKEWGIRFLHNDISRLFTREKDGSIHSFGDIFDKDKFQNETNWFRPRDITLFLLQMSGAILDVANQMNQNLIMVKNYEVIAREQKNIPILLNQIEQQLNNTQNDIAKLAQSSSCCTPTDITSKTQCTNQINTLKHSFSLMKEEITTQLTSLSSAQFGVPWLEKATLPEAIQMQFDRIENSIEKINNNLLSPTQKEPIENSNIQTPKNNNTTSSKINGTLKQQLETALKGYGLQQSAEKLINQLMNRGLTDQQITAFFRGALHTNKIDSLNNMRFLLQSVSVDKLADFAATKHHDGNYVFTQIEQLYDFFQKVQCNTLIKSGSYTLNFDNELLDTSLTVIQEQGKSGHVNTETATVESAHRLLQKTYGEYSGNREAFVNNLLATVKNSVNPANLKGRALILDGSEKDDKAFAVHPVVSAADGAHTITQFKNLGKMYQAQYKEATNSEHMKQIIQESINAGPPPLQVVIIRGHGNPQGIKIGEEFIHNASFLEGLALAPDATILLDSCSTGHGRHTIDNFANKVANALPGRTIFANTEIASSLATTITTDTQNKLQIHSHNPPTSTIQGNILYTISKENKQELCAPTTAGRPLNQWCNFVETQDAKKSIWW